MVFNLFFLARTLFIIACSWCILFNQKYIENLESNTNHQQFPSKSSINDNIIENNGKIPKIQCTRTLMIAYKHKSIQMRHAVTVMSE